MHWPRFLLAVVVSGIVISVIDRFLFGFYFMISTMRTLKYGGPRKPERKVFGLPYGFLRALFLSTIAPV